MPAPPEQSSTTSAALNSANFAAVAALRELPEALIVVFDRELNFLVTAGQAFERVGRPSAFREGQSVAGAFPDEVWSAVEPLFRSALEGETRSREVWTRGSATA